MKDGIPADIPKLGYVLDRVYESELIEPVRFYPVRMRALKSHDWQPRYELHLKVQNSARVEMLVDSGAELSLITKQLGEDLGCSRSAGESISKAEEVGGTIEYLLRDIEIELDGHTFTAPVPGAPTDFCDEILVGREVVFDLLDIEFKQADERIIFKWRPQSSH
jgi:hypothetical protein